MPAENRFVFVEQLPTLEERLVLAEILPNGWAREVSELARIPGDGPTMAATGVDGVPEKYWKLEFNRTNRFVAAVSLQHGIDFLDTNIKVFDLENGQNVLFLNEHTLPVLNRTTCRSEKFEEFLETERGYGVEPEQLARYDYAVSAEGLAPLQYLEWNDASKLVVAFLLDFVPPSYVFGNDIFEFEVDWRVGSARPVFLACNGGRRATVPPPETRLAVAPLPPFSRFLPQSPTTYIHWHGRPLPFQKAPQSNLDKLRNWRYRNIRRSNVLTRIIAQLPWNRAQSLKAATMVAGYPVRPAS